MQTLLDQTIDGYSGDTLLVPRSIPDLPSGRTVTKAWMTIKTNYAVADPGILQKVATTTAVPGVGQVIDIGADGEAFISLEFTPTDTGTTALPDELYFYDIQIKMDNGDIFTTERGIIRFLQQVTKATS